MYTTNRIKHKLSLAKNSDLTQLNFGASSHQYKLYAPTVFDAVEQFELMYQINLPYDYKTFVTEIGDGGVADHGGGAGPFYGIYAFGTHLDKLIYHPQQFLKVESCLKPDMSDELWGKLTQTHHTDNFANERAYEAFVDQLFAGILIIGEQGAECYTGLIVSGEHSGRIVYLDANFGKPVFSVQPNFLAWYEHWLDQVIEGQPFNLYF